MYKLKDFPLKKHNVIVNIYKFILYFTYFISYYYIFLCYIKKIFSYSTFRQMTISLNKRRELRSNLRSLQQELTRVSMERNSLSQEYSKRMYIILLILKN